MGGPIRLSTPCTGPSVAEQFLPPGKLEAVSVMDATLGSLRLTQSRNQHPHAQARLGRPELRVACFVRGSRLFSNSRQAGSPLRVWQGALSPSTRYVPCAIREKKGILPPSRGYDSVVV